MKYWYNIDQNCTKVNLYHKIIHAVYLSRVTVEAHHLPSVDCPSKPVASSSVLGPADIPVSSAV